MKVGTSMHTVDAKMEISPSKEGLRHNLLMVR